MNKAIVHAILKERDSMYYYLDKLSYENYALEALQENEFDPYRKDERYKTLLRKEYVPIPED